jgi:putative ABC transport system substrate-binding protein
MQRRDLLVTLGGLLAGARPARAGAADKVHRIGFLASGGANASASLVEAFRLGMREHGWIEGRNILVDYRFAEGEFDRLPALAAGLVREPVDLIVATPSPAAVAAGRATSTIPIVMASVADPVRLGLVETLARPGGNITGTTYSFELDIFAKQLQLLREALPALSRVAVLSNPASPSQAQVVQSIQAAGRSMGLTLQLLEARAPEQFEGAFAAMAQARAEALLVASDSLFGTYAEQIGSLMLRQRLPSVNGARANVEAGGLLLYGPNIPHSVRQATAHVDKILRGARPGELPVQQPLKFDLVVNLKTAHALGITLPPSMLLRADQVIE